MAQEVPVSAGMPVGHVPGAGMIAPEPQDITKMPVIPKEGPIDYNTSQSPYKRVVFEKSIEESLAAHGISARQPAPDPNVPLATRDGMPLYVVMHTAVGRRVQGQTGTAPGLGLTAERALELVVTGALKCVDVYEERRIDARGRLPGARYAGACAPAEGVDDALMAQERMMHEQARIRKVQDDKEKAKEEESEAMRKIVMDLARRGLDNIGRD
jgi:hypothetical protein